MRIGEPHDPDTGFLNPYRFLVPESLQACRLSTAVSLTKLAFGISPDTSGLALPAASHHRPSMGGPNCDTLSCMAEDLIVSDQQIFGGKPCVLGTRLSVEFLLELAASGATQEQILAQYPQLTPEGLTAAFRYAAGVLKAEQTWELRITA